jgi:hypothetical protein
MTSEVLPVVVAAALFPTLRRRVKKGRCPRGDWVLFPPKELEAFLWPVIPRWEVRVLPTKKTQLVPLLYHTEMPLCKAEL